MPIVESVPDLAMRVSTVLPLAARFDAWTMRPPAKPVHVQSGARDVSAGPRRLRDPLTRSSVRAGDGGVGGGPTGRDRVNPAVLISSGEGDRNSRFVVHDCCRPTEDGGWTETREPQLARGRWLAGRLGWSSRAWLRGIGRRLWRMAPPFVRSIRSTRMRQGL